MHPRGGAAPGQGSAVSVPARKADHIRAADHGVRVLPGGAYVVSFPGWNGYRGALAWGSATTGVHGEISASNCLLGTDAFPLPAEIVENGQGGLALSGIGSRRLPGEPEPPSGVFIPVDGESGIRGWPTSANGFIGSPRDPVVKPSSAWDRTRGRWVMGYGPDNAVVVFGSAGFTGVTGPQGRDVRDESIPARERGTDFGAVLVNGRRPRTFTVTDAGTRRLVLTGDTPVRVTGAHAAEFTVTRQPSLLSPDASSHHFEITFKPAGPGPRTAVVSIASNADGDGEGQNPYSFPIQGAGVATAREVFEDWRAASFGNATGATAPAEDFDSDGVSNLLEFAFGTDPTDQAGGPVPLDYSGPLTAPGGGTLVSRGGPVVFRAPDGTFTAVWLRRLDALGGGLKYVPQFSAGLQTWQAVTAEPVVLASDGVTEAVAMPFPAVDGEG
ncbi:MAG: choice-of-anchor D domain-containing protein, partial [Verrucomicrobiaceae bacterium]